MGQPRNRSGNAPGTVPGGGISGGRWRWCFVKGMLPGNRLHRARPPSLLLLHLLAAATVALAHPDDGVAGGGCAPDEYERCVRVADPLVREPRLVFPDTGADVADVCETWRRFVDCLNRYTERCFSDRQRRQFNRAVEVPIESVHDLCTKPAFQREYLQYAPCIKSTITERVHCGPQYDLLVEQVSQGDVISKATLCCSHDRFKQCVHAETRRLCDRGEYEGPASKFADQIIDKALSFLQDQCYNYIPNSGDCGGGSGGSTVGVPLSDPLTVSTSSSEVYPWSAATVRYQPLGGGGGREAAGVTRETPPPPGAAWLPSSTAADQDYPPSPPVHTTQQQVLGSRSRPSSHGRAMWPETSQTPHVEAGSFAPEHRSHSPPFETPPQPPVSAPVSVSVSTVPSLPELHTVNAWNVMGARPPVIASALPDVHANEVPGREVESSTRWYPAAGSQMANEADEPNQQGLVKPQRGGSPPSPLLQPPRAAQVISLTVVAILASFC